MSAAPVAAPDAPFKGLAPFEDSPLDALLFFGREREIEIIGANVLASRLTVLYGPSGDGAHAEVERVDLASLERVRDVIARIAVEWCT